MKGWLKAGVMEGGNFIPSEEGTPQGGSHHPSYNVANFGGGGDFFVRGRLGAVGTDTEDDPDLFLIDLDPFDQGADNLAAGQPIRRVQTSL